VSVVVELLVENVPVFGFDLFEPDVPIGAVDGNMSVKKNWSPPPA
jgi:hypothetical protein